MTMRDWIARVLVGSGLLLGLVSCSGLAGGQTAAPAQAPYPLSRSGPTPAQAPYPLPSTERGSPLPSPQVVQPDPGKASIVGQLYSTRTTDPIPETAFYLTAARTADVPSIPLLLIGPQPDQGDVIGVSGPAGEFVVNSIPPGVYILVVWAPYDWVPAIISAEDPAPRLITLVQDEELHLGRVAVPWP